VDWVLAGAVTPVKNQGSCGSCYTFSAIGALEGARVIFGKQPLTRLSEQQMLECTSGAGGNYGCNGGLMDNVFRYMMTRPTCLDNAYPYTGVPKTCRDSTCGGMPATVLRGYVDVQPMSDDALAGAVRRAPTSVAVQADQPVFQFYSSGVVTSSCGASVDHAVLAVGFGTSSTAGPYWKIKNSWGAAWGEGGYIRIARGGAYNGGAGQCGVYTMPSYPVLAT
jgi:cathepsin L